MPEELARHPWAFECKKPECRFSVCARTEEHAQEIAATHPCPYAGGTTTIGLMMSKTLLQQVWDKVDADMLSLMQPEAGTDFPALKTRLRAFAEVLAIFMVPHFTTADEVAREAKRRYDNRMNDEYETPGLGIRRYEVPPGTPDKYAPAPKSSATKKAAARPVSHKFTDKELESIKLFSANGFTPEQLAKAHGVGVAVIKSVLSS